LNIKHGASQLFSAGKGEDLKWQTWW